MSRRQQSPATSASATSGTTLRPRTRRLISIEGDESDANILDSALPPSKNSLRNAVETALSSSGRSPAPSPHPSRATSLTRSSQRPSRTTDARSWGTPSVTQYDTKSTGIWASWASLQNVASTLLGSSVEPSTPAGGKHKSKHARNYSLSVPEEPWGPSGNLNDILATGSREERLAKVQTEKRKALLAGIGNEQRDTLGRYKRRSSLDRTDSIPSPTHDDNALVYIHRVQPSDSVAGLSIKYSCTQTVVRKSNRLWLNDSIQLRKIAYIPIDACGIRGKRVSHIGQSDTSFVSEDRGSMTRSLSKTNVETENDADYHIAISNTVSAENTQKDANEEQAWIHDSWVILPHSAVPVEIGRMPRRTLGFFPPARRKSVAEYSDTSPPRTTESEHTPPRGASSLTYSTQTSPGRGYSPAQRPLAARMSRSNSAASRLLNPHARLAASVFLRGPGGVGSLHSNVHGPAPDELNRFVAQHMPQLIIQDGTDGRIGTVATGHSVAVGGGSSTDPRLSFDGLSVASGSTTGTGVEAVAGAVEGWMRKVGGRVKESLGTPEMRGRGRSTGAGDGDLIELVEGWDLNGSPSTTAGISGDMSNSWESEGHGVLVVGDDTKARSGTRSILGSGVSFGVNTNAKEEETLLRERFPPVGKIFEDKSKRKG